MLIQSGQAFGGLEVLLSGPSAPGDFHQGGQGHPPWRVAAVEGQFPGAVVAADQQPAVPGPAWLDAGERPVVVPAAFGALASGVPLPRCAGQAGSELTGTEGDGPGLDLC